MLLLSTVSILLIFITLNLGIFARDLLGRLFRTPLHTDLLELFLLGLMLSTLYFSLLSFWLPVNYWTLIPPLLLAAGTQIFYKHKTTPIYQAIKKDLRLLFSSPHWPVTALVGIILLIYWIIPCGTYDSVIYHFRSIAWNERFKVVPGLANLNCRLGFNPASFIIQSAYSFTGPVGQSLYPLNGVAAAFLFSWLLLRVFNAGRSLVSFLYIVLIILVYRHSLIDISSPSSDCLSVVSMVYVFVRLAEYSLSPEKNRSATILLVVIILYGITLKPATFALLLAVPYLFFTLPRSEKWSEDRSENQSQKRSENRPQKRTALILPMVLVGLFIYLPWMCRNYILSGYLVFPFAVTGFFQPGWHTPPNVVKFELFYINTLPKIEGDFSPASIARSHTLLGWFIPWVRASLPIRFMDIFFLFLALVAPLYWLIRLRFKKGWSPLFPVWTIAFLATLAWLQASPVFRFGAIYIYITFLLPAFDLAWTFVSPPSGDPGNFHPAEGSRKLHHSDASRKPQASPSRFYPRLILLVLICSGAYFVYSAFNRPTTYRFTLGDCWLKPLKSGSYDTRQTATFPYRTLKNGTRLYLADSTHECINACMPCMEFNYGQVEMRGPHLDDGFRNIRDEVKLHYPEYVQ